MPDEKNTLPPGVIRVQLDYNTTDGTLQIDAPQNYHFLLAVMRLAEAQVQFQLGEQAQKRIPQKPMDDNGISVHRTLPPGLRPI